MSCTVKYIFIQSLYSYWTLPQSWERMGRWYQGSGSFCCSILPPEAWRWSVTHLLSLLTMSSIRAPTHQKLATADPHPLEDGLKPKREAQETIFPCSATQGWQRFGHHPLSILYSSWSSRSQGLKGKIISLKGTNSALNGKLSSLPLNASPKVLLHHMFSHTKTSLLWKLVCWMFFNFFLNDASYI